MNELKNIEIQEQKIDRAKCFTKDTKLDMIDTLKILSRMA